MYLGVLLILAGWADSYRSWPLAIYTVLVLIVFHLRVVFHEEPRLARTFGDAWTRYRQRAPRWLYQRRVAPGPAQSSRPTDSVGPR